MNKFKFSQRSENNLKGVHPDLVNVVRKALELSEVDFTVTEGVRSQSTQHAYVAKGVSQTMLSKHLIQKDGYGHAIDIVPYPVSWELEQFYPIAEAFQKAAEMLNVKIRWGGAWVLLNHSNGSAKSLVEAYSAARRKMGNKVFIDAPHFELA